ncbi:MAG: bifunctional precorrin-2 dehydrogenase/sirohydrochlorin ferrochelatase [Cyclobacteriaceae bacterium]
MNKSTPEGNVLFPIFIKLHKIETLIVGGGYVGLEKLEAVLRNSPEANVTLVGKEILQEDIYQLAKGHKQVKVIEAPYKKKYLKGKDLVILATDSRKLHEKVKKQCRKRHILANVADTPDLCDFYLSSVAIKGDLKIAISSNGKSPTLTKRFRQYLEEALPAEIQDMLDNLEQIRDQLKGDFEYKVKKLNEVTSSWMKDKGKKD